MFLSPAEAAEVRKRFGTPCYVYDRATLEEAAGRALAFPHAFGLTVRYAMKANSCRAVLTLFRDLDLRVDASSDFEVERALRAGFAPERIALTSQAPSRRLRSFVDGGIRFTACSLHQLERFGDAFPGRDVTIRVNPGLGSGAANRVNTGGPASSFGIWHEDLDQAKALAARYGISIAGLHTHIGSGSDPAVWTRVARLSLEIAERLPDAIVVSLGGGFKVARVPGERGTDLEEVGAVVREEFLGFKRRTGRALDVEIERVGNTLVVRPIGAPLTNVLENAAKFMGPTSKPSAIGWSVLIVSGILGGLAAHYLKVFLIAHGYAIV